MPIIEISVKSSKGEETKQVQATTKHPNASQLITLAKKNGMLPMTAKEVHYDSIRVVKAQDAKGEVFYIALP